MIIGHSTPAPVGPQAPTRVAASDSWQSLRDARGAHLWTTGAAWPKLDERPRR